MPPPDHATEKQAKWARQALYAIVTAVRPNAVALVDGFGFTDYLLNSALGRSDGDVYKCALHLHLADVAHFPAPPDPALGRVRSSSLQNTSPANCQVYVLEVEGQNLLLRVTGSMLSLSCIGTVCRALLEMAQSSPLNDSQEGPAWEGVLQPRLAPHAKL
jgi:Acyl-CoA oxidase